MSPHSNETRQIVIRQPAGWLGQYSLVGEAVQVSQHVLRQRGKHANVTLLAGQAEGGSQRRVLPGVGARQREAAGNTG